jgi:N utilization substance protein A
MASINLIEAFQDFKEAENIDRPTMMKVVEDVFKTLLRKKYGSDENFDVIVNAEKVTLRSCAGAPSWKTARSMIPLAEIAYTDAVKIEPDYEVGEELYEEVEILDFGRRAILAAKQTLASRIGDLKKNVLVKEIQRKGRGDRERRSIPGMEKRDPVAGRRRQRTDPAQIRTDPPGLFQKRRKYPGRRKKVELKEQFPGDHPVQDQPPVPVQTPGDRSPRDLRRTDRHQKIVREPGERAKVAVESYDDRIDPVGACVGMKGSRIHGIVRELKNENIDVINWTAIPSC